MSDTHLAVGDRVRYSRRARVWGGTSGGTVTGVWERTQSAASTSTEQRVSVAWDIGHTCPEWTRDLERVRDELTHAGTALRAARKRVAVALSGAGNAARAAYAAGVPEVQIAERLNVNRTTVRSWLGKPRKH